mmetsp:Transcript_9428/g.16194  ORF Transcript_9428/g.16194 Transcript_9428/m.16194 type:complete len:260 (+) Transcript_9428:134-913(+)|eukprot:CAMPEP_0198202844 /NCGR_PEP_ID=MMETSP1445-20131203/6069_1 /TAXON_ID=36898 /ORGANISM="Pyramimonas sp., Strain CCMP2087" /LENGTH=259 /DNA_ID=CAMNT_0043873963 /DNA_START=114 /DNA_END=893 /DNA_ORIENTATION=-
MSRQMRTLASVGRRIARTAARPTFTATERSAFSQSALRLHAHACLPLHQNMRSFMSVRTLGFAEKGAGATDAKAEPAAAAETETETEKGADADADALDPVTELQAEVKDLNDRLLRSYAEMENVRTRMTRIADDARKFAIQGFVKELLDVADNLRRAVDAVPSDEDQTSVDADKALSLLNSLKDGVVLTERQLLQVFGKHGVAKFESLDKPFDPNMHTALFQMPDPSKPSDTVGAVLKEGYTLNDRVIRPAEVGVVQNA